MLAMPMPTSQLNAIVDGQPLDQQSATQLWREFSAYMDNHEGDFDGFAKQAGFLKASVAVMQGRPTLTLSSTAKGSDAPKQPAPNRKRANRRGKKRKPATAGAKQRAPKKRR